MLPKAELAMIYETVLMAPGMSEPIRVDLKLIRKNILLLYMIIERGMQNPGEDEIGNNIMDIVSPEMLDELKMISEELLQKAGLADMNEKLKGFAQ